MDRPIPGPRFLNPIAFLQSLGDPTPWLEKAAKRYGDPFRVPTPLGIVVVTGEPEGVRAMFTADPEIFEPFTAQSSAPFLGETSLFLASGARHRRDRKLLSPPFNGARMRAYGAIMTQAADRMTSAWSPGQRLDMLQQTQALSLEVILKAVFGLTDEGERTGRIREAVLAFMQAVVPVFIFLPALRVSPFGLGPWARFQRATAALDALLHEEIAGRRAKPEPREDILSLMMTARYDDGGSMSDKELRDELLTLLFAGHETSAIALAWAFDWLHRVPGELDRTREELASLGPDPSSDAITALPYLDAVCQETLRIHPVAPDVPRTLLAPLAMKGYTVPAGIGVMASVNLVHRQPDLYPEPDEFRPARFLERKFTPFEFIPFGGGARRCIGAAFAMYEMKLVLARVLSGHTLRIGREAAPKAVRRGFTMGPKDGVPMVYEGPR